ncbi:hypothetical protein ACFLZN_01540 [Nanoarchaeota archaeon]
MKRGLILILIIFGILYMGCDEIPQGNTQTQGKCEPGYVQIADKCFVMQNDAGCEYPAVWVGSMCCFDEDKNDICDFEEKPELEEPNITPGPGITANNCSEEETFVDGVCCLYVSEDGESCYDPGFRCDEPFVKPSEYIKEGTRCCVTPEDYAKDMIEMGDYFCEYIGCSEGAEYINGECCPDSDKNGVCDADCAPPNIIIGGECCLDSNANNICDTVECPSPGVMIGSSCCDDVNKNAVCDVDECTPPGVIIGEWCCTDENSNNVCDVDELPPGEIHCPKELLTKNYKMTDDLGIYKNKVLDNTVLGADGYCVRCNPGTQQGQNVNLKYCENIVHGPIADASGIISRQRILVDLVLEESSREEREGPAYAEGKIGEGQCESIRNVEGEWIYHDIADISCRALSQKCKKGNNFIGPLKNQVLIGNRCCYDINGNNECDMDELAEIPCPAELWEKEYKFFDQEPSGGWMHNMIVDEDIKREDRHCVHCDPGDQEGQNINYNYCQEIKYGPVLDDEGNILAQNIFVELVLKEKDRDHYEGPVYPVGTFTRGRCGKIPDMTGTWVTNEIVDMKCRVYYDFGDCGDGHCVLGESCSNCPRDCGECKGGPGVTVLPRGGCPVGECLSNGRCCKQSSRFYCPQTDTCYETRDQAAHYSQGACSSFKIQC